MRLASNHPFARALRSAPRRPRLRLTNPLVLPLFAPLANPESESRISPCASPLPQSDITPAGPSIVLSLASLVPSPTVVPAALSLSGPELASGIGALGSLRPGRATEGPSPGDAGIVLLSEPPSVNSSLQVPSLFASRTRRGCRPLFHPIGGE